MTRNIAEMPYCMSSANHMTVSWKKYWYFLEILFLEAIHNLQGLYFQGHTSVSYLSSLSLPQGIILQRPAIPSKLIAVRFVPSFALFNNCQDLSYIHVSYFSEMLNHISRARRCDLKTIGLSPSGMTWSNVILHLCADEICYILNSILWRFWWYFVNNCQNMGLDFFN